MDINFGSVKGVEGLTRRQIGFGGVTCDPTTDEFSLTDNNAMSMMGALVPQDYLYVVITMPDNKKRILGSNGTEWQEFKTKKEAEKFADVETVKDAFLAAQREEVEKIEMAQGVTQGNLVNDTIRAITAATDDQKAAIREALGIPATRTRGD